MTAALGDLASERDKMLGYVNEAESTLDRIALDSRLEQERNERIFSQIEDALFHQR